MKEKLGIIINVVIMKDIFFCLPIGVKERKNTDKKLSNNYDLVIN